MKDGRLCLIYTRFTGGGGDDAAADLAMRISRTVAKRGASDTIVVRRTGGLNVMSVSLLRLANGEIALFYLRKTSEEDCRPLMCLSTDEAQTWSEPTVCITDEVGYYVLNNDRAVQLHSGRLVLPVAWHQGPGPREGLGRRDHVLSLRRQRQDMAAQQGLIPGPRPRAGSASRCRSRAWSN